MLVSRAFARPSPGFRLSFQTCKPFHISSLLRSPHSGPKYTAFCTMQSGSDDAAPEAVSASDNTTGVEKTVETVVQYVVLRRDLWMMMGWPLGSVVAQACHASTAALWLHKDDPVTQGYCAEENIDNMRKVVLEIVSEMKLRELSEELKTEGIQHKLWIEQPENFATCLATKPYPKSKVAQYFKKLKLCKGT